MRRLGIIAVLSAFLLAMTAMPALATGTTVYDPAAAPAGTHLQTGTPTCSFAGDGLTVVCSSYELAGVGNTDATATLETTYSATINCTNRGGELVEVHSDTVTTSTTTDAISPKNGRLTVPTLTSDTPTEEEILEQADCPNPNWTPSVEEGSIELVSSTYTLTFEGFKGAYITIIDP